MSTTDRRKGSERRTAPRYIVNINVEWEGSAGRHKGTINDLSLEGCFVLCSGEVEDGDQVLIFFPLSDGIKVQFQGIVVNHTYDIGFGLNFSSLSVEQKHFLSKLIHSLKLNQ